MSHARRGACMPNVYFFSFIVYCFNYETFAGAVRSLSVLVDNEHSRRVKNGSLHN